jgi:hypothetical protein
MSDFDNLGPAPDIDSIDTDTMDFGDVTDAAAPPEDTPSQEQLEKEVDEANAKTPTEAPTEAPEGDEPERDEKGRFTGKGVIPVERHKATLDKEREAREAAEQRAAELERRLQEASAQKEKVQRTEEIEAEIEGLETKYQELLLDGNTKEAGQIMRQIRHMEREIATAEAEARATQTTAQALESERMEVAIARLEANHPEFNTASESYDPDLVALVLAKQKAYISNGDSPSKAMIKAGEEVAKRFLGKSEDEEAKGLAKATQNDRQKQAVTKALETQKAQPASMKDAGADSDSRGAKGLPDVSAMSADEFAALPEATQARLMGNLV